MSKTTKFFDVECDYGHAYNLKELRRILEKVIGKKVKSLRVERMDRSTIRAIVKLYDYTDVDFKGIQQDVLNDLGVILIEVAADGSSESMRVEAEVVLTSIVPVVDIVSPSTIPVMKVVEPAGSTTPRSTRRTSRSRKTKAVA